MIEQKLLAFIFTNDDDLKIREGEHFRWHWTYADGQFEADYGFDIVIFNQPEPTHDGYFLATAPNNKTVLINMVYDEEFSRFIGRCCYIDDYEALKHLHAPETWS